MKKLTIALLLLGVIFSSTDSFGQIGKIKSLKDKVKKSESGKGISKPAVSSYDKSMKEATKAETEGDYVAAYKAYNKALAGKYNDYSAKSGRDAIEDKAEEQYTTKLKALLDEEDCKTFKSLVSEMLETISMTPSRKENWELTSNECELILQERRDKAAANSSADAVSKLASSQGYFTTDYGSSNFSNKANVGDDLFVKFKMGKTMHEHAKDLGISDSFSAYGFIVITIDGKNKVISGPHTFTSNYSKSWTDFDVALSVPNDFAQKYVDNPDLLSTSQAMWMVTTLNADNSIPKSYIETAILNMAPKNGSHTVKVEFGLGEQDDKGPKGIICSSELTINVDDASKKELYKKGPKHLRPLDDNERGTFTSNASSFKLGENELKATLSLPEVPKYYRQKWCKAVTCDYDHGNLELFVEVDGIIVGSMGGELEKDAWMKQKSFDITLLTKNDNQIRDDFSPFNKEVFFSQNYNNIVYAMTDLIYSGRLKAGKHKIRLKLYSSEVIPYSAVYENTIAYNNQWIAIAENSFEFTLTDSQIKSFIGQSNAKKISHAGGSFTTVDNHLKQKHASEGVTDVACQTEWKVTKNTYGVILYRTCKADVTYKSTEGGGYRISKYIEVREDYNASSYGKPYFNEMFRTDYGPTLLNTMHFPVPISIGK